jgi:2OG-Fe(II) oxygenase superfamily
MSALANLPLSLGEDMQVVHYGPGGFYQSHHDYFDPKMYPGGDNAKGKNRLLTLLLYLNDVEGGGQTNFPLVGHTPSGVLDSECCCVCLCLYMYVCLRPALMTQYIHPCGP